jgi:hypothetical protein
LEPNQASALLFLITYTIWSAANMTEATWTDQAKTPEINWRMSAALENVPRGGAELAEVTSLEGAVRAWLALDTQHQTVALLTPEQEILIDGVMTPSFLGTGIAVLAERLPKPGVTS